MLKLDSSWLSWRSYWTAFTFLTGLLPVLAEAAASCVCRRLDKTWIISSLTVSEWRAGRCDKQILPSLQLLGCCWKNGNEAIFFHNICTRIYNDTFIVRHFLSALKAAITRCLKRSHKVECGWEERNARLTARPSSQVCFFYIINSRG